MKYTKAIFKNFIGFQIGLGVTTVEIDLSKSKNRMILCLAPNRSGKTTLFEGITLFSTIYSAVRGENNFIIDDKDGYRELHLTHNGLLYISKVHWLAKGGTRCFLTVIHDGIETELNPSGLVRAYEEVLFTRFGLTKDHNKLLFLGPGLRDIISASPSERKTNMSKFTPNIAEYLELNKSTAKYFSKLKNDISVIVSELHRLGDDKDKIILLRDAAKSKYDSSLERLQYLRNVESNSMKIVSMLTVNGTPITVTYDATVAQFNDLCIKLNTWNTQFTNFCAKYNLSTSLKQQEYIDFSQSVRDSFLQLKFQQESSDKRLQELMSSCETTQAMLNQKQQDYSDYVEKNNPEKFLIQQETLNKEITESEHLLNVIYKDYPELKDYKDLFNDTDATKYLMFIDTSTDRANMIQSQYGEQQVFEHYINRNGAFIQYETERDELREKLTKVTNEIVDLQKQVTNYEQLKTLSGMLSSIPKDCVNTNCPFIIKAKEYTAIHAQYSDLIQKLSKLTDEETLLKNKLSSFDLYVEKSLSLIEEMHKFSMYIASYSDLFTKFPDYAWFSDPITFFKNIIFVLPRARAFSEFSYTYKRYKEICLKLVDLKGIIESSAAYYNYVKKCEKDIQELKKQIVFVSEEIQHLHNDKRASMSRLEAMNNEVSETSSLPNIRQNIVVGLQRYSHLKDTIKKLRKHYVAGKAFEDKISKLRSKISFIQNDVSQYERDLTSAEYNMRTFDEYEKKRDILTEEYGLLETLRKAWSPTTGVPLIFIEGFMNNLLSSANKYLAEIWPDQELYIEGFTIDEKNFFINVKQPGSLIPHDASVCSGAERATLTTVLSLALLKQFPKIADMYNVTKFDEIDGTLDYEARRTFIGILNDLLDDIRCEQAFFISHSDTFQSDVDVILLKNSSEYENRILNGQYNVIHRQ
jgi:hypothetical protein